MYRKAEKSDLDEIVRLNYEFVFKLSIIYCVKNGL